MTGKKKKNSDDEEGRGNKQLGLKRELRESGGVKLRVGRGGGGGRKKMKTRKAVPPPKTA